MPTARESVQNRPLTGAELKKIILADVDSILDNLGVLTSTMAFGRCAYDVRVVLHIDNVLMPEHSIEDGSVRASRQEVEASPELAAIERAPLTETSGEDVVLAAERQRRIASPNAERSRLGLPVTITRRLQDGTSEETKVEYPPDGNVGDGDVTDAPSDEAAARARERYGLPPLPTAPEPAMDTSVEADTSAT